MTGISLEVSRAASLRGPRPARWPAVWVWYDHRRVAVDVMMFGGVGRMLADSARALRWWREWTEARP